MQAGHPGRPRAPEVGARLGEHGLPSQPQTAAPRQVPPPVVSQAPKPSIHCWGAVVSPGRCRIFVCNQVSNKGETLTRQTGQCSEGGGRVPPWWGVKTTYSPAGLGPGWGSCLSLHGLLGQLRHVVFKGWT